MALLPDVFFGIWRWSIATVCAAFQRLQAGGGERLGLS
jgi:hypothetical protein